MKTNRIQCKNKSCNYNEIPYNIEWNCYLCNNTFYNDVKIYNPIEVQEQELLNNISNAIRSQVAAYSNDSIVNNDEIAISDDENKKHI